MVTAICTSKSELEFNVLSARRYVSVAQRNAWWGWGLKPTLGADNRATSEQINKRVRESAHTGNFARAWRGRRGPCNPPLPFNNAPDRLFNTHIFIIIVSTHSERGFRSFFRPQYTPRNIVFIFHYSPAISFLTLYLHCVSVSTCIPIRKIRTPQRNPSPCWRFPSLPLLSLQHRRIVH